MRSPVLRWLLAGTLIVLLGGIYTISTNPTSLVIPSIRFLSSSKQLPLVSEILAPEPAPELILPPPASHILPIPVRTLVINLERRPDRRANMELLRAGVDSDLDTPTSGSAWTYVAAQDAHAPWPVRVLHRVRELREAIFAVYPMQQWVYEMNGLKRLIKLPFAWPEPMPAYLPRLPADTDPFDATALALQFPTAKEPFPPLSWAEMDYALEPFVLDPFFHLTRSVVACYRSHLSALELAARQTDGAPSLIMEDDVDMEVDIRARLDRVWDALPQDWDVVFLGHCWSNETFHPPLPLPSSQQPFSADADTTYPRIYPSHAPLCLHAYLVSPAGAARLLSHLTLPSFAYSRPVDNAIARLVETGRLKSYTVVPNVVIQRAKRGLSDISGRVDNTGGWNATLVNGFFDRLDREEAKAQAEVEKVKLT
ncbi:hypothetical protein MKEN_01108200 [Mycena kentingensis (nom. inval.)]|nr:hypothetical protein MKEN_01108200 [Mycena kentingensis (nom. inval.)]